MNKINQDYAMLFEILIYKLINLILCNGVEATIPNSHANGPSSIPSGGISNLISASFYALLYTFFCCRQNKIDRPIVSAYLIPPSVIRYKKNTGYASFVRSYVTCGTKGSRAIILQQHRHGIAAFIFLSQNKPG